MSTNTTIASLFMVLLVGVGVFYMLAKKDTAALPQPVTTVTETDTTPPTSAMRAEENAIVVTEQKPSKSVTASVVYLAAPGYVVIHEDKNGEPGSILGSSILLPKGENTNVSVTLSRATKDGDKLHAMLHSDTNANAVFDAASDMPVASRLGGPIEGWFDISASATENTPVTI